MPDVKGLRKELFFGFPKGYFFEFFFRCIEIKSDGEDKKEGDTNEKDYSDKEY